jgi:hypothetical protein
MSKILVRNPLNTYCNILDGFNLQFTLKDVSLLWNGLAVKEGIENGQGENRLN